MRTGQLIASGVLAFLLVILMSAFSSRQMKNVAFQSLNIEIRAEQSPFLNREDVRKKLLEKSLLKSDIPLEEINSYLLEETVRHMPAVASAEVFSNYEGTIIVKAEPRRPILRFTSSYSSYYLDNTGHKMPLSSRYTAPVPLVTGALRGQEKEACTLMNYLREHERYKNWFTGLHITEAQEWVLFHKNFDHHIELGGPENFKEKLQRLSIFYQYGLGGMKPQAIQSISLKYQDQVICKRK